MGRNKEPIRLLAAKGKSHLTKAEIAEREQSEVTASCDNITPPDFLTTKQQRKRFDDLVQELMRLDIMSNLDCDVLGRYVIASEDWAAYSKLVRKLQKKLLQAVSQEDDDKIEQYTAWLTRYEGLLTKAFGQCHTCASALGMTITSRCRIVVPKKDERPTGNKFSEYIS